MRGQAGNSSLDSLVLMLFLGILAAGLCDVYFAGEQRQSTWGCNGGAEATYSVCRKVCIEDFGGIGGWALETRATEYLPGFARCRCVPGIGVPTDSASGIGEEFTVTIRIPDAGVGAANLNGR